MRNTQFKLFISYSALIVILFGLLLGTYYMTTSANLRESKKEEILNDSLSICETFEQQISVMNDASMKLVYSNDFKDNFFHNLQIPNDSSSVLARRELTNIIYSVSGPTLPYLDVNIINTTNGKYFCTGQYTNYQVLSKDEISSIPVISMCIDNNGKKVISGPHPDPFGRIKEDVFSVSRAFSEKYNYPKNSVIIVQQKYSTLSRTLDKLSAGKPYFIFRKDGVLFNNNEGNQNDFESIFPLLEDKLTQGNSTPDIKIGDNAYISGICYSCETDYYIMVVANEADTIIQFTKISLRTLIIGIILIGSALIASFFISKVLTMPIERIKNTIESIRLSADNTISFETDNRSMSELEWLESSISDVAKKLDSALADILNLKTYEAEARLRAFQMQMGPHFLYNTLSIIGIHAQNSEPEIAKQMCDDLCSMLRYIGATGEKKMSSVEEELDHTEKYVSLMRRRYPEKIECIIDVDVQIFDYQLPCLTIQPIVENCIKYGISSDGQWHIHIKGCKTDYGWTLSISDKGKGFGNSEEVPVVSTMIGLKNIEERLNLAFGEKVEFEIDNLHPFGAIAVIRVYE